MNMVVDVGNTFTKVGIFEKESLKEKREFASDPELRLYLQGTLVDNLLVSSVRGREEEIITWTGARRSIILLPATPLPIRNQYATPGTLGADRLAAACGAWLLYPGQDSLVIDAGTCINYEFITRHGEYLGGAISPGVKMRFESMHHFTENLPVAIPVSEPALTGTDTIQCLQSGVMNGVEEEIKGVIQRYRIRNPDLRVILCGGDAHFFENHLKPSIFVAPELVLVGLNSILLHNVHS